MDLAKPAPGEGWVVLITVAPKDADAINEVKAQAVPAIHVDLLEHEDTGVVELVIVTRDTDIDQAIAWAQGRYARMRQLAGLEALDGPVLGAFPGNWQGREAFLGNPRDIDLLTEARRALDESNFEWAVVAAQAATEVRTVTMVSAIAGNLSAASAATALQALKPAPTLTAKRMKKAMCLITSSPPQNQAWWGRYTDHVTRRNEIAHAGLRIVRPGAEESVAVCREVVDYLNATWATFDQEGVPKHST